MDGGMDAATLLARGGAVMYVLLALSVAAGAIVIFKGWQFTRLGLRDWDFVEPGLEALGQDPAAAGELFAAAKNPAARVLEAVCGQRLQFIESEMARRGSALIRELESWLRALSGIAHLSPLLGLLGTVLGMIRAFMAVEAAGSRVDPAMLSGGIWIALLTTAFGLLVAIPAMAAFYWLEGRLDSFAATLKDACARALERRGLGASGAATEGGRVNLADEDYGV